MHKTRIKANSFYAEVLRQAERDGNVKSVMNELGRRDLFFLLTRLLHRTDVNKDWLYARCCEVQDDPNGRIDLWAREHYKSTIITYAKTIQDILDSHSEHSLYWDREVTVGIFSATRPLAKDFLQMIKTEFEGNTLLKEIYPDVLWDNPQRDAPSWSLDNGIIVKRKSNPREATVEAWGIVDGMPTGKHFVILNYDDVVTEKHITTSDMMKKTTTAWELSTNLGCDGGVERYIGTRYHFNDTYRTIMDRKAAKPRIYAATSDGTAKGKAVFITQAALDAKRRKQGPYTFACHGAGTQVTMADWSQKPIEQIVEGDRVIGWERDGGRAKLVETTVRAVNVRDAATVRSTLANGDVLVHTPDHKWWTGRTSSDGKAKARREYAPLGFKPRREQRGVCQALDLSYLQEVESSDRLRAAGYLAGMIDADGSVSAGGVRIAQDAVINADVCKKIRGALTLLGFRYTECRKKRKNREGTQAEFILLGGRQEKVRLLELTRGLLGKAPRVEASCYGTRNFGKGRRVALVSQEAAGVQPVYNIQTVTGNYLANGYCSKNCQMLQNPKAEDAMGFIVKWLKYYEAAMYRTGNKLWPETWNYYLLCDPAGEKKKDNDYTVMLVVALGPDGNYYLVDGIRDRLGLVERTDQLFAFYRKYVLYGKVVVGYEKYGKDSDIEHIEDVMERDNYRFPIVPLGGAMPKNDRIRRLVPVMHDGRVFFPHELLFIDYEGRTQDFVKLFIEEELEPFPVAVHDDMLDCFARIRDPQLGAEFPEVAPVEGYLNTEQHYDPLTYR